MTELEEMKRIVQEVKSLVRKIDGTGDDIGMLSRIETLLSRSKEIESSNTEKEERLEELQSEFDQIAQTLKTLIENAPKKLWDVYNEHFNEVTKDFIEMGNQANEEMSEKHKVFIESTNALFDKLTGDIKSKAEEIGKIKIDVDQDAITKTIKRAVGSLDYGEFQKFHSEVQGIKEEMKETKREMITALNDSKTLRDATIESVDKSTAEISKAVKSLSENSSEVKKQMKEINRYTRKANLFDYMMVSVFTTVAWGGAMHYYFPDVAKHILKTTLGGLVG